MKDYLIFIIIGLTSGSAYALASLGLVLTYRTSGIFNFAHGAIAMVAGYAFYSFRYQAGIPTAISVLLAVLVIGPVFGLILDRTVFKSLHGASVVSQVVATVGLLILLQTLAVILYTGTTIQIPNFLPTSNVSIDSLNVGWNQIIVVILGVAIAIGLGLLYQFTKFGLNTRAQVNNRELAQLEGIDTRRLTAASWAIGSAMAGLAGVILIPAIGLDSAGLTLLVLQAFGAAAVGRLISLPWAYVGGLIIGVLASLSTKWAASSTVLVGLPSSIPFLVLFVALFLSRRQAAPVEEKRLAPINRVTFFRSESLRKSTWVAWFAFLFVVPVVLGGSWLLGAGTAAGYVIVLSSLFVLVGISRQVSLCQGVFATIGVLAAAHMATLGVPWLVGLLVAAAIAIGVAGFLSIPAIRISGLYLALVTFGFGILIEQLVWPLGGIGFGGYGQVHDPRPSGFTGDDAYYWLILAIAIVTVVLVARLRQSRLGRLSAALADSESGLQSLGVRASTARVVMFCISGALAAVGGALLGGLFGTLSSTQFNYNQSLLLVAVLVTAGLTSPSGIVLGAILFGAIPTIFTWGWLSQWSGVFFGLNAMLFANRFEGLVGSHRHIFMVVKGVLTKSKNEGDLRTAPFQEGNPGLLSKSGSGRAS